MKMVLLTAVAVCCCVNVSAGEAVSPTAAVERLIRAAQTDDLDGVSATVDFAVTSKGHSGMPVRRLIGVLRKIDPSTTMFRSTRHGDTESSTVTRQLISLEGAKQARRKQ